MPRGIYIRSQKHRDKQSEIMTGNKNPFYGKKHSDKSKEKMSISAIRKFDRMTNEEKLNYFSFIRGKIGIDSHAYIEDRSKLKRHNRRNDSMYADWRLNVYRRDNYKCKINNEECNGRIEAHHILCWREYSELRYTINNGITLCQTHHPRVRVEEKRLIPEFQELVSVSKEINCK